MPFKCTGKKAHTRPQGDHSPCSTKAASEGGKEEVNGRRYGAKKEAAGQIIVRIGTGKKYNLRFHSWREDVLNGSE